MIYANSPLPAHHSGARILDHHKSAVLVALLHFQFSLCRLLKCGRRRLSRELLTAQRALMHQAPTRRRRAVRRPVNLFDNAFSLVIQRVSVRECMARVSGQ